MKLTDDEVLAIIDEATIALGEILLSHRQLTEDFLERHGIEQAEDRIEKRRAEIQKERERIRQMKDAIRHRREVERIRKQDEKEAESAASKQPQTETIKNLADAENIISRISAPQRFPNTLTSRCRP
jgi:membrane protein involved in colicin uptake